MEPKPADFITEAKYDEKWSLLKIYTSEFDIPITLKMPSPNDNGHGLFIAAAINEKIEREKGEKESFNRVEVINHNQHEKEHSMGRTFVSWRGDNHIYTQVQDKGKTLKIFIEEKTNHNTPK